MDSLPQTNTSRDARLDLISQEKFDHYWAGRKIDGLPLSKAGEHKEVWLDLGAGTGGFFLSLAQQHSDILFVPVERCRTRGKTLAKRTKSFALPNFVGIRGNAIAHLAATAPNNHFDRIYILYPCPWPKNSHRKNRWYNHHLMPHIVRSLKPGGHLVWTSDQKFYIDEAHEVCSTKYPFRVVSVGPLKPNTINFLNEFPEGRTKFESDFFSQGETCFELIVQKNALH